MRKTLILFTLLLLAGCATVPPIEGDALDGIGVLTTKVDSFDGDSRVQLSMARVAGEQIDGLVNIGAIWVEDNPDSVTLAVQVPHVIKNIRGVGINTGSSITEFDSTGMTSFEKPNVGALKASTNYVVIPLTLLESIVSGPTAKLRVYLGQGEFLDADLAKREVGSGWPTATRYLEQKFLPAVQLARDKT